MEASDIERVAVLGAGFSEGPCRRADREGLDTICDKLEAQYEKTGEGRFEPADYLRELVESGHIGVDAGAGFYEYDENGEPVGDR